MAKQATLPQLPIPVSPRARAKLADYLELLGSGEQTYVRLGLRREGAHQKKILGIDGKRYTDQAYTLGDMLFVIDRRELEALQGHSLDFKETAAQKGFIFREIK
ncbi:MAG: hypothetical protein HYZ16_10075 [Bacteroidetes bacterium]|jgi:Fe-S cluster assembly iron-binding protein IscA|nr:hypothetical protein [Bacteroidota bacterium]